MGRGKRRYTRACTLAAAVAGLACGAEPPEESAERPQVGSTGDDVDSTTGGRPAESSSTKEGSGSSGDEGESSGSGGMPEEAQGCAAPPAAGFDPTQSYSWDPPPPDIVVTTNAASGPGSLRDALASADDGAVIAIAPELAGQVVALDEQLVVPRSVTLDASAAPGFTLDGRSVTRVMQVDKGLHTTLVGLTVVGGALDDAGGGVRVRQADRGNDPDNPLPRGSIEIVGCRFENNRGHGAGALFVGWRIDARVRDSLFVGNDATDGPDDHRNKSGGAIATRQNASLEIIRCAFEDNRGAKAGAVYNILQPIVIEDSVFVGNEATSGTGAIFTDGGNGNGPSNDAEDGEDGRMVLRRVRVESNRGTSDGGAVLLWGYPRDVLLIENSVIANNETAADKGGGARLHGLADIVISGSAVVGNHSEQQGGGLWIDGAGDVQVLNSTFSGNSVTRDAGAGFTHNGPGTLTVDSCLFAYNEAGRAAAGFWKRPDAPGVVRNSIFAFNQVGESVGERHIGPRPDDGGGNIDFATTDPDRGRTFDGALFADPMLDELQAVGGTLLHPLLDGSPAVGHAVDGLDVDARGAPRDGMPDAGPHEWGASCK